MKIIEHAGAAKTGAEVRPLLDEPTVVTRGDVKHYESTLQDLLMSLRADVRDNLVYQNPGKLEADAKNEIQEAADLDGCYDYYFNCAKAADKTGLLPTELVKQMRADALRNQAYNNFSAAEGMRKRAAAHPSWSNEQISSQIRLHDDLENLQEELNRFGDKIRESTFVGGSDWKALQDIDTRYQVLRNEYQAMGFTPSRAMPSYPGSKLPGFGIAGLGIGLSLGLVAAVGVGIFLITRPRIFPTAAAA